MLCRVQCANSSVNELLRCPSENKPYVYNFVALKIYIIFMRNGNIDVTDVD